MKRKLFKLAISSVLVLSFSCATIFADTFQVTEYPLHEYETATKFDDMVITPFFTNIIFCLNDFNIDSFGKSTSFATTEVRLPSRAGVKIELQQFNGTWQNIKIWEATSTNDYMSLCNDWYVAKGYVYRIKTTHTAKNSSNVVLETSVMYSHTVSY